ncbi:MAG TPA: 30S ribosomal protein S8, partial [Actinobacteria bacterium]|nr:30S ribosomal protein S8 [Actinomycetes bacterium]HEX21759.1 30S ribosomal protein S8 [Actinomycetota bacterium]
MSMTDPVADMLTRVRNAYRASHKKVDMPSSKIKVEIAKILQEEGYILSYDVQKITDKPNLNIALRYDDNNRNIISGIKRISKPGRRVYAKKDQIPGVLGGLGIAILSTSRGLMTDKR